MKPGERGRGQVIMALMGWATRATMGSTEGAAARAGAKPLKLSSPDWSLQLDSMKSES